jgi:HTH-type transcriptional regulator/antitoxin HigA
MWAIIETQKEYEAALARLEELSRNPPNVKSDKGRELMLLGYLIDQYETKAFPIKNPNPIEAIKVRMDDLGLKIADLIDIFGDRGTASKVLNKQRGLSLSMIRLLTERLSLPLDLLVQPTTPVRYNKNNALLKVTEPKKKYKKRKVAK